MQGGSLFVICLSNISGLLPDMEIVIKSYMSGKCTVLLIWNYRSAWNLLYTSPTIIAEHAYNIKKINKKHSTVPFYIKIDDNHKFMIRALLKKTFCNDKKSITENHTHLPTSKKNARIFQRACYLPDCSSVD